MPHAHRSSYDSVRVVLMPVVAYFEIRTGRGVDEVFVGGSD